MNILAADALEAADFRALADDSRLAQARERFLTGEPIEPGQVRATILASWQRSRQWHVAADRIDLSYVRDPDLDTPLTRTALPVLQKLHESLESEPVSVILTDAHGMTLSRLTADHDLERHLDRVQLAPGFSYAEEFAGTNGIGTALESGQAAHVFGHEHYVEHLEDLACAAVPIRHPISGKAVGAVNLTSWRKDAGQLLIALVQSTARQVTQGLLQGGSAEEFQLLREYLRTCRHVGGFVFALAQDMVLMNDQARDTLDPGDQAALLAHAAEALTGDHPAQLDVELPTGARVRMNCRPLGRTGTRRLGRGVVHVKLIEPASQAAVEGGAGWQARLFGPALVGSGPLWLRGCRQVEAACASGEWFSLAGEPGTGKLALLRAVHRRRNAAGPFHVLDAAEAGDHDWMARVLGELLEGEPGHPARRPAQPAPASGVVDSARASAGGGQAASSVGRGHAQPWPARRRPGQAAEVLPRRGGASPAPPPHRGPA